MMSQSTYSYGGKIDAAKTAILEHNEQIRKEALGDPVPEGSGMDMQALTNRGGVDPDDFTTKLRKLGGTSEPALREASWEDIKSCGVPAILARRIASIFRATDDPQPVRRISPKAAATMTIRELLESYDPTLETNAPITDRLRIESRGLRCLAFAPNGSLMVDESLTELSSLRQNFPERTTVVIGQEVYQLYKVGERPNQYAYENPLFHNEPLHLDGSCVRSGRSWKPYSYDVRLLIYLAVQSGEIRCTTNEDAQRIHDMLESKQPEQLLVSLKMRHPRAAVRADELRQLGALPTLRVRLKSGGPSNKANDPFAHARY
jgi:hypothetical protein